MLRSKSQCLKTTSLTDPLYIISSVLWLFKKKKKVNSTWWLALENPLPWLSRVNSNPLIVCNQTEKSVEPSLCPQRCQKQQVARILRFFHTRQPLLNIPTFPPTAPDQRRSCCFPPLQIRLEGHCEMSALFSQSFDIHRPTSCNNPK